MQRIYPTALTPEEYVARQAHQQVRGETTCPRCGKAEGWHRHGAYERGVTGSLGQVLRILIMRFLCLGCRRTVSYLPEFALSYRLVRAETFEAFLEGKIERRDVRSWQSLLEEYRRRMTRYGQALWRTVGCGLGLAPPAGGGAVWPWLKEACGGLASAARRLVTQFRITFFKRYQCHQPAGV
jgi:transposase-like protein